jgi:hypothetical protein
MLITVAGKDIDTSELPSLGELGIKPETWEAVEEIFDVLGDRLDSKAMAQLVSRLVLYVQKF